MPAIGLIAIFTLLSLMKNSKSHSQLSYQRSLSHTAIWELVSRKLSYVKNLKPM
jgi:hypothetical protein